MNNRYIFRGKRKDNGEWVEGYYACQSNHACFSSALKFQHFIYKDICLDFNLGGLEEIEVIPETVGQCTGRTDKNGKLVFEGDICKHRSNYSGNIVISVVTYTDGHFLALVCENGGFELSEKLEVIGNIHDDNPELLEVER
nr:MAG TPA: YopX protein [Caudoviricetes sp.]